jgi:bacteriorhodopsin
MADRVFRFPLRRLDSSLIGDSSYRLCCKDSAGQESTLRLKNYTMSLITLLLVLVVVGVILWLINTYIPMDRKIKNILNVVVVIVVVLWLLKAFGLLDSLGNVRI